MAGSLALERLEDRNVPSVAAVNFDGGLWRYDSGNGNWAHLSAVRADEVEVDDSGSIYARFESIGTWRWDATTQDWQKLTDFKPLEIGVTGGGVLYANFGNGLGTWRWANNNWQQLSTFGAYYLAVSDSDAIFGAFNAGVKGCWRYTPAAGWGLLTNQMPYTNGIYPATDDLGSFVADFLDIPGAEGTWRWAPTTGWARLAQDSYQFVVSENGVVHLDRTVPGVWRYDPAQPAAGLVKISDQYAFSLYPDADGSVWGKFLKVGGGFGYSLWRYTPATGWALLANNDNSTDSATGKDHDLFMNFQVVGEMHGLWHWSAATGLHRLSSSYVHSLTAESWDQYNY